MNETFKKIFFWVLIFSIAMGFLEAIVVVYLRDIYYPAGFKFPLMIIPDSTIRVEILREFCTIIMLLSISFITGKNKLQVFSYFLFTFAVWDISYYAGLKLILNWPSSFFTWDILFLIPFPWIGPVLAPIVSSLFMIILSLIFFYLLNRDPDFKVTLLEWLFIYPGAVLIFISFIWDYADIIISQNLFGNILSLRQSAFIDITQNYTPKYFHWDIFGLGIFSICFSIFLILKRNNFLLQKSKLN